MRETRFLRQRLPALLAALTLLLSIVVVPATAWAGTTGVLEGTITDGSNGKPVAGAAVKAVSASGTFSSVTDAKGFYALMNMLPDTYTVQISAKGYTDVSVPGVFVQQDDIVRFDRKLVAENLKTIAAVESRSRGSLLQPYQGSDVYNVSGDQLMAATGGTDSHETEYQYIDTVPGVVGSGGYAIGQPSIRGGFSDVDTGFELDGVPIADRQTGFFGTNLTNIGVGNVEVVTGGLTASNALNGTGVINQTSKVGTYPGYFWISGSMTSAQFTHDERAEWSGATPNGKFSWFISNDASNAQNYYWVGTQQITANNYPIWVYPQGIDSTNAGFIWTRDVLGNFHWRPDSRDDVQVLNLNTYFNDDANYGIDNPGNIGIAECPGASGNAATASGGTGGTAPNGQPCPLGLYQYYLQPGAGNFMEHTSNVFKVQWNHTISSNSSFEVHYAQFFNQYIFDQAYSDPNTTAFNYGDGNGTIEGSSDWGAPFVNCPQYPVANGAPLQSNGGTAYYDQCTAGYGNYFQNRTEHNNFFAGDYTWTPSENVTVKAGAQEEYDDQYQIVEYTNMFNGGSQAANEQPICYGNSDTYPCINQLSDNPAHQPSLYGDVTFNVGKFTLEPGLRWSRNFYDVPTNAGGTVSSGFFAPSLVGTYRMNLNNVFRYSYSDTATYPGSTFVYELNNPTYNPELNGAQAYQPAINHMVDFMWEHAFNPTTTLRFGPYWRAGDGYPAYFTPFIGYEPNSTTWIPTTPVLEDNLAIRQLGAELGISHVDPRPTGYSYWISGSYCNCWTQVGGYSGYHGSYFNEPLLPYFLNQGVFLRNESTPLFAATFTADLHTHGWHLVPYVYWTFDNFYNTGGCENVNAAGNGFAPANQNTVPAYCGGQVTLPNGGGTGVPTTVNPVLAPEGIGQGYWYANLSLFKDINRTWKVGLSMQNVFNMQHGPVPSCFNYGSGCWPYGSQNGGWGPVGQYNYQNFVNGTPRMIEVFARAYVGAEPPPH